MSPPTPHRQGPSIVGWAPTTARPESDADEME